MYFGVPHDAGYWGMYFGVPHGVIYLVTLYQILTDKTTANPSCTWLQNGRIEHRKGCKLQVTFSAQ